ncbi:MAG: hypothetical protein ACUVS5_08610 [Anaerolineae bacterium]
MADTISHDRYLIQFEVQYGDALSALQEAQAALSAVGQVMERTAASARALGESAGYLTEFAQALQFLRTSLGEVDTSQLPAMAASFQQVQATGTAAVQALTTAMARFKQEATAAAASLRSVHGELAQLAPTSAGTVAAGGEGGPQAATSKAWLEESTKAVKEFITASEGLAKLPDQVSAIAEEFLNVAAAIDTANKALDRYIAAGALSEERRKRIAATFLEPPPGAITDLPQPTSVARTKFRFEPWSRETEQALLDAYARALASAAAQATVPGRVVPIGMLSWQAEILELAAGHLIRPQLETLSGVSESQIEKLRIAAKISKEIQAALREINIPIEYYGQQVVARLKQSMRNELGEITKQVVEFLPVDEKGVLGKPVAQLTREIGKQGEVLKETVELYNQGAKEVRILQENTEKATASASKAIDIFSVWNRMLLRHVMWIGQAIAIYGALRAVSSILSDIAQGYMRLELAAARVTASMREQASAAAIASKTMREAARYGTEWGTTAGAIGVALRLGEPALSQYGLGFARLGVEPERMERTLYAITRMFPDTDLERTADIITAAWQKSGMTLDAFVGSMDTAVAMSEIFNMSLYETVGLVSFLGRSTGQSGDQLERFVRIMQTFYTDPQARTFVEQVLGRPVVGRAGERVPLTEILSALSRQPEWVWGKAAEFLPAQLGQPHRPYFVAIMKQWDDYKGHVDEVTRATGAFGQSVEQVMNTSSIAVDRLRQAWKGLLAEMGWPLSGILISLSKLMEHATEQREMRRYLAEYGQLYRRVTGEEPIPGMKIEAALYDIGMGAPVRNVREDFRRFVDEILSGQRDALTGLLKAATSPTWRDVGTMRGGFVPETGRPAVPDLSLFGGTARLQWVQYQPTEDIAKRIQTVYGELLDRAKKAGVAFGELGETVTVALVNPLTGATQAIEGFSSILGEARSIVEKNLDIFARLGVPELAQARTEVVEWEFSPEQLARVQEDITTITQRYREALMAWIQAQAKQQGLPPTPAEELGKLVDTVMDALFGAKETVFLFSETGQSIGTLNVRANMASMGLEKLSEAVEQATRTIGLDLVSWGLTPGLAAQAPGVLKELTDKVAAAAAAAYGAPPTKEQWEAMVGKEEALLTLDRTTDQFVVLLGPTRLLSETMSVLAERSREASEAMREEERIRESVAQRLESWIDAIMENTRVTAEDLYYLTPRGEYEDKFAEPIRRLRAAINWLQAGAPAQEEQPYYRPTMALFGVPMGLSPNEYEGLYERLSRQWTTGGFLGRPDWAQFYDKELFLREIRRKLEEYRTSRALREMQLSWLREAGIADEFLKMEAAAAPATQILFGGLSPKEYADAVGRDYGTATKESIVSGVSLTAEEGKEIAAKIGTSLRAGAVSIGPQVFGPIGEEIGSIMVNAMAGVFRQEGTVRALGEALGEQIAQHLRQYIVQAVVDMVSGVTPP